jgi:histidyl-tRNA synthetase
MVEKIREVYERYGFEPVETPAMEYTDALGKFLPDQDRPNEGVFSFQDDDEQWISLRYDLTAPLARYVGERYGTDSLVLPYRSYRYGWVFRNEKPGPGRFRQFMQFDADTVGAASMAADAEMCMLAADTMEALGFERGQYVVKVNNRKVLDGVMESIGLVGDENAGRRLIVLRALDKYDRLGKAGVRDLLGKERRDESGDITKGADLNEEQIKLLHWFLTLRSEPHGIVESTINDFNPLIKTGFGESGESIVDMLKTMERSQYGSNSTFIKGVEEFREMEQIIIATEYRNKIRIDPSVVRGLEYYTGPVYEVELLTETKDEKGRPVRFGSVGGGGRYDGLVSRFRGEPVPATGFSIGVSRLQSALTYLKKFDDKKPVGPVVVTVFPGQPIADAQRLVGMLRNPSDGKPPIRAELYLGNPKHNISQQLKYADKRGSPFAIIQGPDEKQRGEITIKNLILGAGLTDIKDRDEYLKKQAEAQFAVKETELVEEVRKLLARHG